MATTPAFRDASVALLRPGFSPALLAVLLSLAGVANGQTMTMLGYQTCPDMFMELWSSAPGGEQREKLWAESFYKRLQQIGFDLGDTELQALLDPYASSHYTLKAKGANCIAARKTVVEKLKAAQCRWEFPEGGLDITLADPYLLRGAYTCGPAETGWEQDQGIVYIALAVFFGWILYCMCSCVCGGRSPCEILKGSGKVCKNCKRSCQKAHSYDVNNDDEHFFDARGYNMPKPAQKGPDGNLVGRENPAKTNMYRYIVWRRRSLYAVLLPSLAVFFDSAVVCWPNIKEIVDFEVMCKPGQSLLACGGAGNLARFLTAAGGAQNLKVVLICISIFAAAAQGFQCLAIRIASNRSGDWLRSSRWLMLSWVVPFMWFYFVYAFPLTKVYDVDWKERAGTVITMPFVSSEINSTKFDMCAAANLCGGTLDVPILVAQIFFVEEIDPLINAGFNVTYWKSLLEDQWKAMGQSEFEYIPASLKETGVAKYRSQTGPGFPTGVALSDSGDFKVQDMMDILDWLFVLFIKTPPGLISETADPMIANFVVSLEAIVRSDVTFKCLLTLAPLAMSILPALMKGAIAVKLVLPQDPMVGWLIRGIPLLTVPLHAVFILAVGQMFADWWVCMGCVCFMVGDGAITYFGAAIPASYATFDGPMKYVKKAKMKGVLCMLLGVVFMFLGLVTNDLVSTIMPEVSFKDVNVFSLLHTIGIFIAKFIISKNLMTIIFSDFVISLVFAVNEELQDRQLQVPYQTEVTQARLYMTRKWVEGEPPPSSCFMDLCGKDNTPEPADANANFVGALAKCQADVSKAAAYFDQLDADKSGNLDESELAQLVEKLGRKASDEEIKKMMSYMDADGEGSVDKDEFVAYFENLTELFVIHTDGTKNYVSMPAEFALQTATLLPRNVIDGFGSREPFVLTGEAAKRACIQPAYDQGGTGPDGSTSNLLIPGEKRP